MENFFKLKKYGTNIPTEFMAGLTTFFAMSYILIVNPDILTATSDMPWGGVYLATIIASIIGTLVMALFANVPYATAPGMGLNALIAFVVIGKFGYTWQQALAMVFICGLINVVITVTKLRKHIIAAIPESLQHAISGGIGVFIAYLGLINSGIIINTGEGTLIPSLTNFKDPKVLLAVLGIFITIVLVILKVKGALLISIIVTTLIGFIPFFGTNVINTEATVSLSQSFSELGQTFGAAFGPEGLGSLFSGDLKHILLALSTIFVLSLSDTFDTIGTFIGTGRSTGIFTEEEEKTMMEESGFSTRLDKALFADSIATSIGAVLGTSNTTTFVESSAGIGVGGRTGLASVITALMFVLSIFIAPLASAVPNQATAPVLIIVGIMMLANFGDIKWGDMEEAIPAFFTALLMGFAYSITVGIALGFITYIIVKLARGKIKEVHPILIGASFLFLLDFLVQALM